MTIQNKARPEVAKALHDRLKADFRPFQAQAVGLDLWRYRGGPWDKLARFGFVEHAGN